MAVQGLPPPPEKQTTEHRSLFLHVSKKINDCFEEGGPEQFKTPSVAATRENKVETRCNCIYLFILLVAAAVVVVVVVAAAVVVVVVAVVAVVVVVVIVVSSG